MARKRRRARPQLEKRIDQTSYLTGNRRGAVLKEEVWFQGERVVKYSLAYINPRIFGADNGRILGYDPTVSTTVTTAGTPNPLSSPVTRRS